jgi:hypothetical protein
MRIEQISDVEQLRSLGQCWMLEQNGDDFGLDIDLETIMADLDRWIQAEGTIFIAYDGVQPVGFFAVFAVPSFLGKQKIAIERYWFAIPGFSVAGPRLYCEAVRWAKENNCSHLIINASRLASAMHDKVCLFLEKNGAKPFETSFILELV